MTTVLKPYSSYSPSPVPWLDDVPSEWSAIRLDRLFRYRSEEPLEGDARVTGYLDGRVTLRSNVAGQKIKGVVHETGWQRIHIGDFAISGMNAHLGGMGVSDSEGKCSPIYLVLEPRPGTNAHFVSLAVRHAAHLGAIKALVQTIRFNSADMKRADLKSIYVPLPPPDEQAQIVRFIRHLDHRVNRLIKTKRRLIELLAEQAFRLTLRGIGTPTKPRDSLLLGEIPNSWDVLPAKRIFDEIKTTRMPDEELLAVTQDRGVLPKRLCEQNYVSPSGDYSGLKLVCQDDFVISLRSFQGGIEHSDFRGLVSPAYTVIRLKPEFATYENTRYYKHLLKSPMFIELLNTVISGIRDGKNILFSDFGDLVLPIPPTEDIQEMLGSFEALEQMRMRVQKETQILREYRNRLVADVVTGQLDVRHLDLPEVEESLIEAIDAGDDDAAQETDEGVEVIE